MLKNNKAFTLIEVLVGSSILFIIIITIVPINSLLESERNLLRDRYDYTNKLHDELQSFIWEDKKIPVTYERRINKKTVSFQFSKEYRELIKGCVNWENDRSKNAVIRLYGFAKKPKWIFDGIYACNN